MPMKLTTKECLHKFIIYLNHDNVVIYESLQWNIAMFTLCENAFVISCITNALAHEIVWPNEVECADVWLL